MPEERCDVTEFMVSECAHCLGHVSAEEEAASEGVVFFNGRRIGS